MAKANTTPLEKQEQIEFVAHCKARGIRAISTNNGFKVAKTGFNHIGYINNLRKMGLSKGFPDVIVFAKNSTHEVLIIEMKRQKGGRLEEEQKEWIEWLDDNEYCVGVAHGCESAIRILNKYLQA